MSTEPLRQAKPILNRRATGIAAALFSAVLLAGCGGGPSTPEASPSETPEPNQDAVAYSQCMRDNGVSGYPDPDANGGMSISGDTLGVDINSDVFTSAEKTCEPLLPRLSSEGTQEDYTAALEFSACMRENGVPEFPDPLPPADGPTTNSSNSGDDQPNFDPASPQFQAALTACEGLQPEGSGFGLSENSAP